MHRNILEGLALFFFFKKNEDKIVFILCINFCLKLQEIFRENQLSFKYYQASDGNIPKLNSTSMINLAPIP